MIKKLKKTFPFPSSIANLVKKGVKYRFLRNEFLNFKNLSSNTNPRFPIEWEDRYLWPDDATSTTNFDSHYIYHTAWAARKISKINPNFHTDISSNLYFSTIISAFITVKFYDFRPVDFNLSDIKTYHADLTALKLKTESIKSLSCMHVVEHIGLGRYGDPLDPGGDLKAIKELKRVLAIDGDLLFVVPVGKPKIMFNAHRIYSYNQILSYFDDLKLAEFSLIPDYPNGCGIIYNASKDICDEQNYGCGCFWFKKIK